jgi:hypothetical protein
MGAIVFLGVLVILFVLWMIVRFIRVMIALNTNDPSPRQDRLLGSVDNKLAKSGAYGPAYDAASGSPGRVTYTRRNNADGTVSMIPSDGSEAKALIPLGPTVQPSGYQPAWQPTPGQVAGAGALGLVAGAAWERHHQHQVEEPRR